MKIKTVVGIILIILGIILPLFFMPNPQDPKGPIGLYLTFVVFSLPVALMGLFLLFSKFGFVAIIIGLAINIISSIIDRFSYPGTFNVVIAIMIGLGFVGVGIILGIIEGIIKFIKK